MMPEKNPDAALLGAPGRTQMVGRLQADPVEEAAPRIVGEQQIADRLLGSVAGQRGGDELVADLFRERRAEHGDRGREDEARPIGAARQRLLAPDRLEQRVGSAEIDCVALVEIGLGLSGDHRGKQENDVRPRRNEFRGNVGRGKVEGVERNREGRVRRGLRRDDVDEMRMGDRAPGESPVARQPLSELPPDHARRADDEHFHDLASPLLSRDEGPMSREWSGSVQSFRRPAKPDQTVKSFPMWIE